MKNKRAIGLTAVICVLLAVTAAGFIGIKYYMPEIKSGILSLFRSAEKKPELNTVSAEKADVREYTFGELEQLDNVGFDSSLMLVNSKYMLPSDYSPELTDINDSGVLLDGKFADAYLMLRKAVKDNCDDNLYIMSSYRSREEQQKIRKSEGKTAAKAGASEHQTGLAADVYVMYHAGAGFLDSEAGKFVNENCKDYGFIIRYPDYGVKSTGFEFEPWHIRFVGLPHSDIIMSQRLTLEEYVGGLTVGVFYGYGEYVITRQSGTNGLSLPRSFDFCTVSPDNTGNYICTVKVK